MSHFSSPLTPAARHRAWWHGLGLLLVLLGLARPHAGQAQAPKAGAASSFFQVDGPAAARGAAGGPAGLALRLDTTALRALLRQVPAMGTSARGGLSPGVLMALPLPDGSTGRFRIYESSVMAPALAARCPQIKTYSGIGVDDPTASVALDMTPLGFHAMVLSDVTGASNIEPAGDAAAVHYRSIALKDVPKEPFSCGILSEPSKHKNTAQKNTTTYQGRFNMYRLALACTPEYTALVTKNCPVGTSVDDKKKLVMATMATLVNIVNIIYAKELTMGFELVLNNMDIIFVAGSLPADYNPYPASNVLSDFLEPNQKNATQFIGNNFYDIGHVLHSESVGFVGMSIVGCAGQDKIKASGASNYNKPAFQKVSTVLHEMGHQFGAEHIYNGLGAGCGASANPPTGVEPGSGTTIMGYSGACGSDNISGVSSEISSLYFNHISHDQISTYIRNHSSGTSTLLSQTLPLVSKPTVGNDIRTIPQSTPFRLILDSPATSTVSTNVVYNWEEDDGNGILSSLNTPQHTNDAYPLFRSLPGSSTIARYCPRISSLISGIDKNVTTGEKLPTVYRTLQFVCTARESFSNVNVRLYDNTIRTVPVVGLQTSTTTLAGVFAGRNEIRVSSSPAVFKITTSGFTHLGSPENVTLQWDVAGTSGSPYNCTTLNLYRVETTILDGSGEPTLTLLRSDVPNNGSCDVTTIATVSTLLLLSAKPTENYFFNIGYPDEYKNSSMSNGVLAIRLNLQNSQNYVVRTARTGSGVSVVTNATNSVSGLFSKVNAWGTKQNSNGTWSFLYGNDDSFALDISAVALKTGLGLRGMPYDPASASQQFKIQDVGDGRFRIFAGDDSGRLLEAYTPTGSTTPAVRLVPYVALASATDGQKWDLDPVYDDFVVGQAYNLQPANGRNLALSGTAVQLAPQNDATATAQQWTVKEPAAGYYTFTSVAVPASLLTVTNGALTTATASAAAAAANPQYFRLVPSTTAGYYKVLNLVSNQYLQQSTAASSGLALTASATAAGTDWRFNDVLVPTANSSIKSADPTVSAAPYLTGGNLGANLTLSATPAGWQFRPSPPLLIVATGAALAAALLVTAPVSLTSLSVAIGCAGVSQLLLGSYAAITAPLSGTRRALLATTAGTLEQTYRLGLLANGKYLIFDVSGDHVMTRQADGSIAEADYTGAANQQWDLAPTAPLAATLYATTSAGSGAQITRSQAFAIGDYDNPLPVVGNDAVDNLTVPTGLEVTLFADKDYSGSSWNFRSDANGNMRGAVKSTSSVKVRAVNDVLQEGALYSVISRSAGGTQLLQANGTASQSTVSTAAATGSSAQYWGIIKTNTAGAAGPAWTFVAQNNTSQCLDVFNGAMSTSGTVLQLYSANGSGAQQFQLAPTSDGYVHIVTSSGIGNYTQGILNSPPPVLCLETTANGVQLMPNTGPGHPEQEWRFERVNPAAMVYENASPTYTGGGYAVPLGAGRYTSAQLGGLGVTANTISALKVSPDYEILLFASDNFAGRSWRYLADAPALSATGSDNLAQSLLVRPRTNGLVDGQAYTITNASTGTLLQATGTSNQSPVTVGGAASDQVLPNQCWTASNVGTGWTFSPRNAPLNNLTDNGVRASNPYSLFQDVITVNQTNSQQYQLVPIANGNFQIYTAPGLYSLEARNSGKVLLADPAPTNLAQQWRFDVVAPVTVYVGTGYTGAIALTTKLYSQADLRSLGVSLASNGALQPGALRVADGYEVVLYSGDAGTGTVLGDYFTDQPVVYTTCASLLVRLAPVAANAYSNDAYQGTDAPLSQGRYTSAELLARGLVANDVSSLKVPTNYEVVLFDNGEFTGPLWNYRANHPVLTQDAHGHQAADLAESIIVRPLVLPVNGATYWVQPVQAPSLALGSSTGVANGPVAATTFNYALPAQQWVVEMDTLGLWSLRQPGGNYLDAPDRNVGTALTYGSPGFFPQAFHLVNVEDNIWRIMGRDGLVCATLNANNTVGLATPLAFDAPTQCWYLSRVSNNSGTVGMPGPSTKPAADRVTLYPNPATATITLQDLPAGATVTVLDLLGKTMLTSTQAVISIAPLPPGVYIAVVGQQRVRFIKQ